MIQIISKKEAYSYDAYHIAKMFFNDEEIRQQIDKEQEALVKIKLSRGSCFCVNKENIDKQSLNRKIYRWFQSETNKELPWGILTGIRPTKIVMKLMKSGLSEGEIRKKLNDYYYVSKEKMQLSLEVAKREEALIRQVDCENGYSLYVGIPFCPTRCSYCSFTSYPIKQWQDRVDEYLETLCQEISFVARVMKGKVLSTIYIGGGTPTTLKEEQLEKLLGHIQKTFSLERLKEYTVEAGRPDSIDSAKLKVCKKYGVTRISINPQTMNQKSLEAIGRAHSVEEVESAFNLARDIGFDNINMDLIAGLANEGPDDMEATLRKIAKLDPDSLTVHALAIKRASRMKEEDLQLGHCAAGLEKMLSLSASWAQKMGMQPYYLYRQKNIAGSFENVGYVKVDKAGIYNILIMEEVQSIIAVGAGATTKVVLKEPIDYGGKETNIIRIENVKDVNEYIKRIDEMMQRKEEWIWR